MVDHRHGGGIKGKLIRQDHGRCFYRFPVIPNLSRSIIIAILSTYTMARLLVKATTPRPGLVGLPRASPTVLYKLDGGRRWQHYRGVDSTLEVSPSHTNTSSSSSSSSSLSASSAPPLAALPNSVLLRSLLVAAISSKPYLLGPSLWALSILTQPGRGLLLDVDRNPLLHGILKQTFYKQFCAGENPAETQVTLRRFKELGFRGTILTYAKETVFDHKTNTSHGLGIVNDLSQEKAQYCPTIEAWRKGTVETIDLLGDGDYLAVKYASLPFLSLFYILRSTLSRIISNYSID